ncbi:hypothetical protein [Streptomyces rubiginosohelvolus]|uniref:hypothetical protein n=1 Tax=Streptomyces rubiginosohelvolus TaxID=67362 RepID=UPI0037877E33
MTTPLPSWLPRRTDRRTVAPYVAVPREPADPSRTGRRWVRRRALGLTADAAAAALDVARSDAREAELREAMQIEACADELQALRELGTLDQAEPRQGDEAVRDELTRRADGYVQDDVDAWFARALATHLGHYRAPAGRKGAAAGLLTPPVLAHAALLAELLRLIPGVDVGQLAFAARLATTEPEAAGNLAAFLIRARPER